MFSLAAARKKLGISQRKLAKMAHISQTTVQRMEACYPDGDPGIFSYNAVKAVCGILANGHPFFRRDFVEEFYTEYDASEMILNWIDRAND